MIARSLVLSFLTIAVLSLGACQMPQKGLAAPAVDNASTDRGSLGYLEHRGRRHALLDLLDPAYRAASDDPVARNFSVVNYCARRSPLTAHVGSRE